jgi:DNA-binding MarR family transcriptional regulator
LETQDTALAHDVLRMIRRIVRRISEHSRHLSGEVGLTVPQLMCLKAIGELGGAGADLTVMAVAQRIQLSAATTSRVVDKLVRSGLVERTRADTDRRRVLLSLTPAGARKFAALPAPLQDAFIGRLLALPPDERAQILETLGRIAALMDASELDAAPILTTADPPDG